MKTFYRLTRITILLLFIVSLMTPSFSFASSIDSEIVTDQTADDQTKSDLSKPEVKVLDPKSSAVPFIDPGKDVRKGSEITPREPIISYIYTKTNVTTYENWSPYRRVSDNISTFNTSGGNIESNDSVTFGTEITGGVEGLGFSFGKSITSAKAYVLNVGPNKKVYMAYRVRYKVESGTRQKVNDLTRKVEATNYYTIRIPQYGEYSLQNS